MSFATIAARSATGCIFCGASDLTREHVFPRWLATILTATVVGAEITSQRTQRSADGVREQRWRAADVASFTIRVVCASCNNGWMSEIEGRAKVVLAPMVSGHGVTLTPAAQLDLAAWTAMKALVVECALGSVVVSSAEERRAFKDAGYPLGAAPVRVGAVERSGVPNSVTRIVYNVGRAGATEGVAACTTFALGCAALQVCFGLGITIDWANTSEPRPDHLPINPPCTRDIQWPPAVVLSASSLTQWESPIPASDPAAIAVRAVENG